jgi:hypothetical protein
MSALSAFLHPAVTCEEKEIIISKRFLGEDGKPVPFKIRALTQEKSAAIIRTATRMKLVNGQLQESVDANELSARTIVEATVFPDFRSAELCEAYGTKDPVQVPGKMLLAGEFGRLIDAVSKLSGFDKSLDEEAKN